MFTGHFHNYDWLCHLQLATFLYHPLFIISYKGDQVTKPIIVVKMSCELLASYHSSERIFNKKFYVPSWPAVSDFRF